MVQALSVLYKVPMRQPLPQLAPLLLLAVLRLPTLDPLLDVDLLMTKKRRRPGRRALPDLEADHLEQERFEELPFYA